MAALKCSITKSRSGHYTVAINSSLIYPGRLFIARKVDNLRSAQLILKDAESKLLDGDDFKLDWDALYTVHVSNINRHFKQAALVKEVTA